MRRNVSFVKSIQMNDVTGRETVFEKNRFVRSNGRDEILGVEMSFILPLCFGGDSWALF